ncbi:hypothetical protein LEMLEM_LOCUS6452, partial [Lemmus lemmus]
SRALLGGLLGEAEVLQLSNHQIWGRFIELTNTKGEQV